MSEKPILYDVLNYGNATNKPEVATRLNYSIIAHIPICGMKYSERAKTICSQRVNHDCNHYAGIYVEDSGKTRAACAAKYFTRAAQQTLFYEYSSITTHYTHQYTAFEIEAWKFDPVKFRQDVFDKFWLAIINTARFSTTALIHAIRCLDDFKYFKIDYRLSRLSYNVFHLEGMQYFHDLVSDPELPCPIFFSEQAMQLMRDEDKEKTIPHLIEEYNQLKK